MRVKTDHQVVAFGADLMGLFDGEGTLIVQAARVEGGWQVTAEGVDVLVENRKSAITGLTEVALQVLPGSGYSTLVPRGLEDLP